MSIDSPIYLSSDDDDDDCISIITISDSILSCDTDITILSDDEIQIIEQDDRQERSSIQLPDNRQPDNVFDGIIDPQNINCEMDVDDQIVESSEMDIDPATIPQTINTQYGFGRSNNWERYCYIEPSHTEVLKSGKYVQVKATNLKFKGLGKDKEYDLIRIPQILDNFIKKVIADNGCKLEDTLFCITISHQESTYKEPLYMVFRQYPQTDGTAIFNMMGKINQSNSTLTYDGLNISMIIYNPHDKTLPLYQGGIGNNTYFDVDKKIRRRVRNVDTLCLARAIVLGQAESHLLTARTDEEKNAAKRYIKQLTRRDRPALWKKTAEDLLTAAGIPLNLPRYGTQHMDNISKVLSDYKIEIYAREINCRWYTLADRASWNPDGSKIISIAYHDNHFDYLHTGRKTVRRLRCRRCHGFYTRFESHKCSYKCKSCHRMDCEPSILEPIELIVCKDCNLVFRSQTCFNNHKIITGNNSNCDRFKICLQCGKSMCMTNERGGHDCLKSDYCEYCKCQVEADHSCCWKPPKRRERDRVLSKQEKYKIIFFDIESVVVETTTEPEKYANTQWANLIVCEMICQECYAGVSDECDCLSEFHFGYRAGDGPNSVVDRCIQFWLNDSRCADSIIISHNGSRYDNHFILAALIRRHIAPQLLQIGSQLLQMTVVPFPEQTINKLTFKDSYLLVPLPLAKLPEAFDLTTMAKGEFPFLLNHPEYYGRVLPQLPDPSFYMINAKKPQARNEFLAWYEENKNKTFNFDEELLRYCKMDVSILRSAMCKYMVQSMEISGWNPLVQSATCAAFSMHQLKHNHFQRNKIAVLPVSGYNANEQQSGLALKMLLFLEQQGKVIRHKLNGGEYNITIGSSNCRVDGFEIETNTVYEILGCLWHGCPACFQGDSLAPGGQKTFSQLHSETLYRLDCIKEAGYNVVLYWEHEIESMLTEDADMKNFFNNCRVRGRLIPRDAFLGGRTQTYKMKAEATTDKIIEYVDFNSLYPATTSYFAEYPIGSPTVILDKFKSFKTGQPSPYRGVIKCDILPPRSIQYPVIGCRIKGKLVFPICYTCALRAVNTECCHETEQERMLHVTVCDVELTHALQRGYKVIKVYEVWEFESWERGSIFKEFNDNYTKVKMESSGWPARLQTEEQKSNWLSDVYEHTGIRLDPNNIKKNPGARTIAKLALNSSWGKMGERSDKTCIEFVNTSTNRLDEMMMDPSIEITGTVIVEDFLIVAYTPTEEYLKPRPFSNVIYASITTATARLKLLEAMELVGDNLIYTDTDSLMYYCDVNDDPLKNMRGEWIGMLVTEIPVGHRINKFVSPAAKVYSIEMCDEKNRVYYTTKVKGVTLDYDASQVVGFDGLTRLVDNLINKNNDEVCVNTSRVMITRQLGVIGTKQQNKQLKGVMDKVLFYPDFSTRPYGYRSVTHMSPSKSVVSDNHPMTPSTDHLPINAIRPGTHQWTAHCIEHRLSLNGKPTRDRQKKNTTPFSRCSPGTSNHI